MSIDAPATDDADRSPIDVDAELGDRLAPMFRFFAETARDEGIDAAVSRFASSFTTDEVASLRRVYGSMLRRVQSGGRVIAAAGREDWYPGPIDKDTFWNSLSDYFKAKDWDDERLRSVDESSSQVVAHTPRPGRERFAGRGLVVGYVQSGKTTNFTAVAAKMADLGYNFVVVLSGIHNGLRRQTQERLEEQLRGLNPDRWFGLTEPDKDFQRPGTSSPSVYFSPTASKVTLAVVKKNATVLRRLRTWLTSSDGQTALQNARVLIIDDEADQASVATGSINPIIRELLDLMPRHTYIGYTATPFANVFIDPTDDDLYPRDFVLNLPKPSGYFGPETVFGRDSLEGDESDATPDGHDMVRAIPDDHVTHLRPRNRIEAEDFVPTITAEVRTAVQWFLLASAARRARGDLGHSTMLVHTSVKTSVHESFGDPLRDLVRRMSERWRAHDGAFATELRGLWERETQRVKASDWGREQNTFDEVAEHLAEVFEAARVILDNSRSDERLDYGDEPVVAIAVGGNTLSRGLTLEGLVVSLFVRGASTYDTLLQMGRWFGYRIGYEDLPRIWTTDELADAFRHLAQVEADMRRDIERYQVQNKNPTELAVRIRTHPSLRITAKMGAAQPASISYAGARLQTRYFERLDREWLTDNIAAAERLVAASLRGREPRLVGQHRVIEGVDVGVVKSFLTDYHVHPDQVDLDTSMLIDYIDRCLNANEPTLEKWNVAVIEGSSPTTVRLDQLEVKGSIRSRLGHIRSDDPDREAEANREMREQRRADIKTLMSRRDMALDLGLDEEKLAKGTEAELRAARDSHERYSDRGLLVLYAIDPVSTPSAARAKTRAPMDAAATPIGVGIVLPGRGDAVVRSTHMAVDLSDVETEDESDLPDDVLERRA